MPLELVYSGPLETYSGSYRNYCEDHLTRWESSDSSRIKDEALSGKEEWKDSEVYTGEENRVDKKTRKSQVITCQFKTLEDGSWYVENTALKSVIKHICDVNGLKAYRISSDHYDIIKYQNGDFFKPHRDHINCQYNFAVSYVLIVYLSTPEGGGTRIETDSGEVVIPAVENTYCLFQSHLVHEGMPIISGEKIIAKTDLLIYDTHWNGEMTPLQTGVNFVTVDEYLAHMQNPEGKVFLTTALGIDFEWPVDRCGHAVAADGEITQKSTYYYDDDVIITEGQATEEFTSKYGKYSNMMKTYDHETRGSYSPNQRGYRDEYEEQEKSDHDSSSSYDSRYETSPVRSVKTRQKQGCVFCGVGKQLKQSFKDQSSDDYYGLRLLKACLKNHFNRLVKYVSIQGRSVDSFRHKLRLPSAKVDYSTDMCYNRVSHGTYTRTGGHNLSSEYSSICGIRELHCDHLKTPSFYMKSSQTLPDNYLDILHQFKQEVKNRVLTDKTNEAVKLSHTQESSCNEAYYLDFKCGFVFHAIYLSPQ